MRWTLISFVLAALPMSAGGAWAQDSTAGAEDEPLSPVLQRRIDQAVQRALEKERAAQPEETSPAAPKAEPGKDPLRFVESNVVSLVGRDGFRWQDRQGRFLLNPYVLVQTRFQFVRVIDAGLDLSDPDNIVSLGFGIPNGIVGVAGKAFGRLSFNLALNGPCGGRGCLLAEAWLEGNLAEELRLRAGKFKTPANWHVQTRLGGKLAPFSPASLTTRVNVPVDINAVNPSLATGFDIGAMLHGVVADQIQYQLGIFNGEGIDVNIPTSTLSDDFRVPALLYAGRVAWMPLGPPALEEGGPESDRDLKMLLGISGSYNVETNGESSSDLRAGVETVLSAGGFYWASEAYLMQMRFMKRMRNEPTRLFWGAYTMVGHTLDIGLETFFRFDVFDRNSIGDEGVLLMPAGGINWYAFGQNLKLSAMYQHLGRLGHESKFDADDDIADLGEHALTLQVQFTL